MSFDRLPSLEAQPTTTRRRDDPQYRDDPEFSQLAETLSTRLFELTSNISRLSQQISLLGTKRDTERVRERVHDLLEETKEGFKDVGEGVKRIQGWEDLNVRDFSPSCTPQKSSPTIRTELKRLTELMYPISSPPKNTPPKNSPANSAPPAKNSKSSNAVPWKKNAPPKPLCKTPPQPLLPQLTTEHPPSNNNSSSSNSPLHA